MGETLFNFDLDKRFPVIIPFKGRVCYADVTAQLFGAPVNRIVKDSFSFPLHIQRGVVAILPVGWSEGGYFETVREIIHKPYISRFISGLDDISHVALRVVHNCSRTVIAYCHRLGESSTQIAVTLDGKLCVAAIGNNHLCQSGRIVGYQHLVYAGGFLRRDAYYLPVLTAK